MTEKVGHAAERVREFLRIVPIGRPYVGEGAIADVSGLGALTIADLRTLVEAAEHPGVLDEVRQERARQDAKWGEQNHPNGTGGGASLLDDIGVLWDDNTNADAADAARDRTNALAAVNRCTYAHILAEEFFEALAEDDPRDVRAELIQVAAVAVAWVEKIDRDRVRASSIPPAATKDES